MIPFIKFGVVSFPVISNVLVVNTLRESVESEPVFRCRAIQKTL